MEVQQQSDRVIAQTKVAQELGFMDWMNLIQRFDFDDQSIVDQEIDTVCVIKIESFVRNRQHDLSGDIEPAKDQFVKQEIGRAHV